MSKIDTSKWGEFKVEDLFDIFLSKDDIQPKNIIDGSIPLISSGKTNNGITTYIENNTAKIWKGNVLTVDMFGKVFYQENDFCCVSHGRVNILIPKKEYSQYILQFIGTSLEKITEKYEFTEMCTSKKLLKDKLYLPITSDGEPNYKYMEEYMKKIENTVSSSLTKIQSVQNKKKEKIDVSCWKEFRVGDFFDIHPTKAYKLKNVELLDNGNSPIVVNSSYNNGIGGFTTQETTEKGNMITFSDTVDANTIFYQPNDFVGYAHVQGLYPIGKFKDCWNKECLMFFLTIFRSTALTKGFDYGNKFRRDIAKQLIIKLPVTSNGEPDWNYMEEYMKRIEEKTQEKLSKFYTLEN